MVSVADVVEAESVTLVYNDRQNQPFKAVEDASFQVRANERFVIIGPSGCGKTTLLMAIAGFITASSGRLVVEGQEVHGPGPDRAVVFQDFDQLFPWRTVLGNVVYALKVTGRAHGEAAVRTAREYLDLVRVGHAADKHPHQLSGGMKQRAAIARALALQPTMLLMDEPFGAVDEITRTALQQELDSLCRRTKVTVVMVTHSIQEAIYLGDRVMVMSANPGRVKEIVDTSAVNDFDTPAFDAMTHRLRGLLDDAAVEPGQLKQ